MITHSGAHEKRTQISLAFLIKQRQQQTTVGARKKQLSGNYLQLCERGAGRRGGGHKNTNTRQINQPSQPQFINVAN